MVGLRGVEQPSWWCLFVDASYKEAWNDPSVSLSHHNRVAERPRVHQPSVRHGLIVSCRIPYVPIYGIGVPDGEAPYTSGFAIVSQDYCLLVKCLGPWMAATSSSGLPVKDLPQLRLSSRAECLKFCGKALAKLSVLQGLHTSTFQRIRRFRRTWFRDTTHEGQCPSDREPLRCSK